jgi:hypothetical protein
MFGGRSIHGQVVKDVDYKTTSPNPLTAVGSNPARDFRFFNVRKLSSMVGSNQVPFYV